MNERDLRRAVGAVVHSGAAGAGEHAADGELHDLVRGELPPDETEPTRRHLLHCTSCMDRWRELSDLLAPEATQTEAPGDSGPHRPQPAARDRRSIPWLRLAAAVALGIIGLASWRLAALRAERGQLAARLAVAEEQLASARLGVVADLYPDSLLVRDGGREEVTVLTPPSATATVLVLNTLSSSPAGLELEIREASDRLVFSRTVARGAPEPLALVVPAGILRPGPHVLTATVPGTGAPGETFSFRVE